MKQERTMKFKFIRTSERGISMPEIRNTEVMVASKELMMDLLNSWNDRRIKRIEDLGKEVNVTYEVEFPEGVKKK